jgi:hypothetical protein
VDVSQYANTPYASSLGKVRDYMITSGRKGFSPEKLGEVVHTALTAAKPKTRYTVSPQPFQNFLMLNLPKRTVDNMVAGTMGLKNQKKR